MKARMHVLSLIVFVWFSPAWAVEHPALDQTITPVTASAEQIVHLAQQHYQANRFEEALTLYKRVLTTCPSDPEILYNAGNCAYRIGEIGFARAFYLRAQTLRPRDPDIRHNLAVIEARIPVQVKEANGWHLIHAWFSILSMNEWAVLALVCFLLFTLGVAVRLYALHDRHLTLFLGIAMGLCLVFTLITIEEWYHERYDNRGVVVVEKAIVKSQPTPSSQDVFVIYNAMVVHMRSEVNGWSEIRLDNGFFGWLRSEALVRIADSGNE